MGGGNAALLRATNASLCACRRSEVPRLQLCLWHQMGVQQALEEQARPEVGGKRRRAQVGGNCVECGIDLDISKHKRTRRAQGLALILRALGFLAGELGTLQITAQVRGCEWARSASGVLLRVVL